MNQNLKQVKQQFKQLETRIDALSLRERGILFLVILGLLFWVATHLVFASLREEQQRLESDVRARLSTLLRGAGGEHEIIIFGVLLVLIMIFMPQGLSYAAGRAFAWLRNPSRREREEPLDRLPEKAT